MISYKPLRIHLVEIGMNINELDLNRGGIINGATVSKLRHDKPMHLSSIVRVCRFLDLPIENVCEVISE